MERMTTYKEALKISMERYKELEEENKKLKSDLEQFSEAYKRYRDFEKEELAESCCDLERENKKLKEDSKTLESAIGDVVRENRRLEKEIEKLKEERIFSLGEYDYMILTSTTPQLKIIKKNQNYSLMEEDTLQELRDIGEI